LPSEGWPPSDADRGSVVGNDAAVAAGSERIVIAAKPGVDRELLGTFIADAGYPDVRFADAPDDAHALLAGAPIDLLILDVMQTRTGVMRLLEALRAQAPRTRPAVLVVAPPENADRIALCLKLGADDYLVSPYESTFVRARITMALARRRLSSEVERLRAAGRAADDAALARRYSDASSRFVPREFLEYLKRDTLADVQLGDHIARKMTVFFSDIRDFTALSESLTPQENFQFLNSYLKHVNPIIREHRGFIDKYIGDAIMALFPHDATDALTAAVELYRNVVRYNEGRLKAGYAPIRIGIGLHHGELILGTIGENDRMQTTVIADAVNVASRMEGLTKHYGVPILASGSVVEHLAPGSTFHLRHLGAVKAKGKAASVDIYECFDNDPADLLDHKVNSAELFASAMHEFQKGLFLTAGRYFSRVAAMHAGDIPAAYYRDRCMLITMKGTGAQRWDGADLIESK
jgi:two-component system sensor histidine kinase ChiS